MSKAVQNARLLENRLTLRQLSRLNVPASVLLPPMIACLRRMTDALHGGFFYTDENLAISNMYVERMLSPNAMANYHEKHFDSPTTSFRRAFKARMLAKDPVSRSSLTVEDCNCAYYYEVLKPLEIFHIAYAVVRHHGRVIGQLSLYRGPEKPSFSDQDLATLREVLLYLGPAFDPSRKLTPLDRTEPLAEESSAVVSSEGHVVYAGRDWNRLVRMARGQPITPATAAKAVKDTDTFVRALCQTLERSEQTAHILESSWGKFQFRGHLVQSNDGDQLVNIMVSRFSNDSIFTTEAVAKLKLPSQQREVAVFLVQGKSNREIAEALGVSVHTASYHVKALFQKLNIHDRSEVIEALKSAIKAA